MNAEMSPPAFKTRDFHTEAVDTTPDVLHTKDQSGTGFGSYNCGETIPLRLDHKRQASGQSGKIFSFVPVVANRGMV